MHDPASARRFAVARQTGRAGRACRATACGAAGLRPERRQQELAHYNRGLAYARKGEYDRPSKPTTRPSRSSPTLTPPTTIGAFAYARKGEYRRAESDFSKALTLGYDRTKVEATACGTDARSTSAPWATIVPQAGLRQNGSGAGLRRRNGRQPSVPRRQPGTAPGTGRAGGGRNASVRQSSARLWNALRSLLRKL